MAWGWFVKSAEVLMASGRAYAKKGQYDRAIADYDEAIKLDPKDAIAFFTRGITYYAIDQDDRAIADLDEAIRLDQKNAYFFSARGDAYADKGDHDRAIADYNVAIRLGPKTAMMFCGRGRAYKTKGQYDRAIADSDEAIRLDPENPVFFAARGDAYYDKGDYDRAIANYDEAIRLNPNFTWAINLRDTAIAMKNDLGESGDNDDVANNSQLDAAAVSTEDELTSKDTAKILEYFRGKTNTKDVLEEKAKIVAHFIIHNCDSGLVVATALKDTTPEIRLGEEEARQAGTETAALLLTLVDRLAVEFLGSNNRDVFMNALEAGVADALQDKGVEPGAFQELVYKRYEEYSHYRKWVPKGDEGAKGTLFWEFGKKVATILCVGQSIIFQALLTNLLMEKIVRWKINELLPEQG
jgi:Flp pilus assembly protein TadD